MKLSFSVFIFLLDRFLSGVQWVVFFIFVFTVMLYGEGTFIQFPIHARHFLL